MDSVTAINPNKLKLKLGIKSKRIIDSESGSNRIKNCVLIYSSKKERVKAGDNRWKINKRLKTDLSPVWTVIVSHGDVRCFQHLQGLVSDFIAV